ncbi:hypothetical protein QR685DRAFT_525160 [Neurospora intermedia]|uniref:Uncharacterized protein n=1 Tax=Neurospora intermedia TaxID=5142 RepID=A0ABR3DE76_NEUIN
MYHLITTLRRCLLPVCTPHEPSRPCNGLAFLPRRFCDENIKQASGQFRSLSPILLCATAQSRVPGAAEGPSPPPSINHRTKTPYPYGLWSIRDKQNVRQTQPGSATANKRG